VEETLNPNRRVVAGLTTLQFDAPAGAPTILFFHGYGADAADLAPLAFELDLPRQARWVFPDAPLSLDWGGRAWFPIDPARFQTGKPVDLSDTDPPGLDAAREAVGYFIEELGVPWKDLILGGFSQGAMLAVDLALRAPESPRGLVVLSGNLVSSAAWTPLAPKRKGLPFFQSHGVADPILSYAGARKLETLLAGAGLQGELVKFDGGHAIAPIALERLRDYLAKLV
jgi:phospholipase/carboxylesterase